MDVNHLSGYERKEKVETKRETGKKILFNCLKELFRIHHRLPAPLLVTMSYKSPMFPNRQLWNDNHNQSIVVIHRRKRRLLPFPFRRRWMWAATVDRDDCPSPKWIWAVNWRKSQRNEKRPSKSNNLCFKSICLNLNSKINSMTE